jgi:phospholipid/cholesterol/gamma-HCH transport system substrate-binding protein
MRSFRSRNPYTIGIVGIAVIVLVVVAALNANNLPIIGGGTTYSAYFTEDAGLRTSDDVVVAGVKVGKVTEIKLDGAQVRVDFQVKDAWIGDKSAADIKIKTLLGSKYLSLTPQGDAPLDPNTPIPVSRTTSPYDVIDAFSGLSQTVQQLNTTQLAQSFETLSQTFANTPADVKSALTGLSALSQTISSRDAQLSQLLSNTGALSKTISDRDAEVQQLLSDGTLLLGMLQQRKQAIDTLLTGTQTLSTQLTGLVQDNQKQLTPVLQELGQFTTMLKNNQSSLANGITLLAPFARLFANTIGNGRWFDNYICGLVPPAIGPVNQPGCLGDTGATGKATTGTGGK